MTEAITEIPPILDTDVSFCRDETVGAEALPEVDEIEALADFLMDSDDLSDFTVTNENEAELVRNALQAIHERYVEETDDKHSGSYMANIKNMPLEIRLKIRAVNNALSKYLGIGNIFTAKGVRTDPDLEVAVNHMVAELIFPAKERAKAPCAGSDNSKYFAGRGQQFGTEAAKEVCSSCDDKNRCLEFALVREEREGVWGEHSERQRRKLRKTGIHKQLLQKYAEEFGISLEEVTEEPEDED